MRGIRGAVCAEANTREAIYRATQHLLAEIVSRNGVERQEICAAFFTMTPDLDADFPAYAARDMGWTDIPMLGAQETPVPGAAERTIRVLVLARTPGTARHVYLGRAAELRPDLAGMDPAEPPTRPGVPEPDAEARGSMGRLLVVGLGLIGGSVAAAARASGLFRTVRGYDRNPEAVRIARSRGLVDDCGTDLDRELGAADIAVLAVPVAEIVTLLRGPAGRLKAGALVTDVGSTKREVVRAMDDLPGTVRAIGGHPMAGNVDAGPGAADPRLFRGAPWPLVPCGRTDGAARERAERLVRAVGACPLTLDAPTHDRVVAITSQLPAVIALALVELAGDVRDEHSNGSFLTGPGFSGATRLAAGDAEMTAQMLHSNADNLKAAIDGLLARLGELRGAVDREGELYERLASGRRARVGLLSASGSEGRVHTTREKGA